jgi:hypothetical protein
MIQILGKLSLRSKVGKLDLINISLWLILFFVLIWLFLLLWKKFNNKNNFIALIPAKVHFEPLLLGKKLIIHTSLVNHTEYPITIMDITPSCSCVKIGLNNKTLNAKTSSSLTFSESTDDEKEVIRSVTIDYKIGNNPEIKTISFFYSGKIVSPIRSPDEFRDLGNISIIDSPVYKKKINFYKQKTTLLWDSIRAETASSNISVVCKKESETHFSLELTLNATDMPQGKFSEKIKIYYSKNGQDTQYYHFLFLQGRILSDVVIAPKTIYLGGILQKETRKGMISIETNSRTTPIKRLEYYSSNPTFITITSYNHLGNKILLSYEATGEKIGNQSGKLYITAVRGKSKQMIEIPFIAYVKPIESNNNTMKEK